VTITNETRRGFTDIRNKVAPERNEATLLDHLHRAVAPKVVSRDVRPVTPNVSQGLVRVAVPPRAAFPVRSVVGGQLHDVGVRTQSQNTCHVCESQPRKMWEYHGPGNFTTAQSECFNPRVQKSPLSTARLTLVRRPWTEPYAQLLRTDGPDGPTSVRSATPSTNRRTHPSWNSSSSA
jgi:hypothetical protein